LGVGANHRFPGKQASKFIGAVTAQIAHNSGHDGEVIDSDQWNRSVRGLRGSAIFLFGMAPTSPRAQPIANFHSKHVLYFSPVFSKVIIYPIIAAWVHA